MDLPLVKAQCGMFEGKIDNDLKMVDTVIREYYELNKTKSKGAKENGEAWFR